MDHRIRSAAIILEKNKILLIKHSVDGKTWLVPPGGGLEEEEDVLETARRETKEETGLDVMLDKIVYLREFVDHFYRSHNLEVFILVKSYNGQIDLSLAPQEDMISDVKFYSLKELKDYTVYPEIIKTNEFWEDVKNNFPTVKYLGKQTKYA